MRRQADYEALLRGVDGTTTPLEALLNLSADIDARISGIEDTAASVAALQAAMVADANALIEAAITPLLAQIRAAADMGVLFTATSASDVAIGGGTRTFVVPEGARVAFAPATLLSIVADADPAHALWCRKLSWDKVTGALVVEVLSWQGSGSHADWTITPGLAATMAGHLAVSATGLVAQGNLQAALAALSAAVGDDPNFAAAMAAALADRPTASSMATDLAGKQAAAATLGVLASIEPDGDSFPYFTSPTAGNRTPLTSYMREVLAMADDAAARTKLGAAAAHNPSITGNLRFGSRAPVDGIFYAGATTSRVFVYDTRTDNDSGRWRSRSQGTRAFTTPAGVDRGARRDFPAIAVIAYDTANRARIYDAEAVAASGVPELWANVALPTSGTVRQIKALNGVLCVGASNGLSLYDLLSDVRAKFDATGATTYAGSAAGGLVAYVTSGTDAARAIVSTDVRGVDMRALAGAPLGTGSLPIPTIAVATAAGASVLLPSGAVVDITRTGGYVAVDFVSDVQLKLVTPEGDVELGPIPTADIASTSWRTSVRTPAFGAPTRIAGPAEGTPRGLLMRYPNAVDDAASLSAHIGPSFNTGWMPANARRALFCDSVLGARTAATPLADDCTSTTGWTLGAGWTLDVGEFDHASGTAALDRALSGLTAGVRYRVRFLIGNRSAGSLAVSLLTAGDEAGALSVSANGEHVVGFTAGAATDTLRFVPTTDFNGSVQDVRVEVSIADRGPAGRDARANGALTMSAGVGEIAHAVGWGAANFVDDGWTADLDFAGDFCVSFNLFSGPGDATIVQRASAPTSGARWEIGVTESAGVYSWTFSISDGAASATVTALLGTLSDRIHMAFVRRGATLEIWRGGVLAASSAAAVGSLANASAGIRYGARVDGSRPMISFTQLKSLVIAASAPTADQIAEMARQDRTTSQANALCCLGGSSAAVTAVDYDPITEQVAVAASGVSTFRGMLRTAYVSALNSQMASNALLDIGLAGATIATASAAGAFCYRAELAAVMVESAGVGGAPAIHGHDLATPALPGFMSPADKATLDGQAAAIAALDAGKLAKAGGAMTGPLTLEGDPSSALDAATKQYVDAKATDIASGLIARGSVRFRTTANVDLAGGGLAAGTTHDGITAFAGDIALVPSQSSAAQNGIYVVPASGAAARYSQFDAWDEFPGAQVAVQEGTAYADTRWHCTSNRGGTLGSTAIVWEQLRVSGELLAANNLGDLTNAATARSNLGLVIGTHVQAYNANLAAFAGLSLIADRLPYANGSGTLALATFTAFGRSLVDDADAAAGCATLGAARLAGATFTGDLVAGGGSDWPFKVRYGNGLSGVDIGVNVAGETIIKGSLNNHLIIRGLGNSAGEGIILQRDVGDGGSPVELMRVHPGVLSVSGQCSPSADNTYSVGSSSAKWSVVYSNTGTINTSDAREKAWRGGLSPAEIAAARRIFSRIGAYRWLSAVAEKGDAARLHIGVLAQDVAADMEAEGLDPATYGFWCADVLTVPEPRIETYDVVEAVTEAVAVMRVEVRDGVPTLIEATEQQPVIDLVPVVDAAGVVVLDAAGEPRTHPVPRMQTVTREKTVTVEVPRLDDNGDPIMRLGLRYDELAMFLLAGLASSAFEIGRAA